MVKASYVTLTKRRTCYRVSTMDIKQVYTHTTRKTPPVPSYEGDTGSDGLFANYDPPNEYFPHSNINP